VGISRGQCGGNSTRICSIAFEFANGGRTGAIGRLTNTRMTLNKNGNVYGFFGRADNDIDELNIVTRKLSAQSDPNYDIAEALEQIRQGMAGTMGFAAVIHDNFGRRVGFVRSGYAIHPLDENLGAEAGQFDIRTKFPAGSTAKVWASAAAALKADEQSPANLLAVELSHFLPARWAEELHPRFHEATVLDVIKHQAGFRRSGPSLQDTNDEKQARFRLRTGESWTGAPSGACGGGAGDSVASNTGNRLPQGPSAPYENCYSNSAGGMFHFIMPYLAADPGIRSLENQLASVGDDEYDNRISEATGRFYHDFVQEKILAPAGVEANCNIRDFIGQHQVAAGYDSRSDKTGFLTPNNKAACAAGGWVISMADLAQLLSQLASNDNVLEPISRARMFNLGPLRVWHIRNGDAHVHDGGRGTYRTFMVRFVDGYIAVLAHNSPPTSSVNGISLLLKAMRDNKI